MKNLIIIIVILVLFGCKQDKVITAKVDLSVISDDVRKLMTNNDLLDTGKAYWIGYNKMMYHIAGYSDAAIDPLVNFIDTTNNKNAKVAACLTIHLIGIESKIAGRNYEEFKNVNARKALLGLLANANTDFQYTVMSLLARDPWPTDIPELFDIIKKTRKDSWPICNALARYKLNNPPIGVSLSESLDSINITIKRPRNPYNGIEFNRLILKEFQNKYRDKVLIEDTLFDYEFAISNLVCISRTFNEDSNCSYEGDEKRKMAYLTLKDLLGSTDVHYDYLGNNFNYLMDRGRIIICSSMTAKKKWVDWWKINEKSYINLLTTNADN